MSAMTNNPQGGTNPKRCEIGKCVPKYEKNLGNTYCEVCFHWLYKGEPVAEASSSGAEPNEATLRKIQQSQDNRADRDNAKEHGLDVDELRKCAEPLAELEGPQVARNWDEQCKAVLVTGAITWSCQWKIHEDDDHFFGNPAERPTEASASPEPLSKYYIDCPHCGQRNHIMTWQDDTPKEFLGCHYCRKPLAAAQPVSAKVEEVISKIMQLVVLSPSNLRPILRPFFTPVSQPPVTPESIAKWLRAQRQDLDEAERYEIYRLLMAFAVDHLAAPVTPVSHGPE
jgi:hypothetical protein